MVWFISGCCLEVGRCPRAGARQENLAADSPEPGHRHHPMFRVGPIRLRDGRMIHPVKDIDEAGEVQLDDIGCKTLITALQPMAGVSWMEAAEPPRLVAGTLDVLAGARWQAGHHMQGKATFDVLETSTFFILA